MTTWRQDGRPSCGRTASDHLGHLRRSTWARSSCQTQECHRRRALRRRLLSAAAEEVLVALVIPQPELPAAGRKRISCRRVEASQRRGVPLKPLQRHRLWQAVSIQSIAQVLVERLDISARPRARVEPVATSAGPRPQLVRARAPSARAPSAGRGSPASARGSPPSRPAAGPRRRITRTE